MAQHNETGRLGETIAANYLAEKGYRVLEKNWRFSRYEVDLICMDEAVLVFVEVKTRGTAFFGRPEEFVDAAKEQNMAEAAGAYMAKINHEWAVRFDVISIVLKNENDWKLEHIQDAFFPGIE